MDFIEGLLKVEGYSTLLVVVDRLSKYAHFLCLRHPYLAQIVASLFVKVIVRLHGVPASIILDRDWIFLSSFWKGCFGCKGQCANEAPPTILKPMGKVKLLIVA